MNVGSCIGLSQRIISTLCAMVCAGLLGAAPAAKAADLYLDNGGGAATNWATAANWDTAPDGTGGNPGAAPGAAGMMATLWYYVPRKEWDKTERIIRESGEAFSKDFPDG